MTQGHGVTDCKAGPTHPFRIYRLGVHDAPRMAGLLSIFCDAFGDPESYERNRPSLAYLENLLKRETFITLVAEKGTTIVGGLVAYVLEKFEQERSEIYIYDLAVSHLHRRQGIATALIGALQPIASDMAAWVIYVQADFGDDQAIALYSGLGTRDDVLHFDIPVPAPGP